MNGYPQLSIIVPVYRTPAYLNKCIESIIAQSFKDWELILVDDGSPDECPQICDAYAGCDQRIKVIHKRNAGVISARKEGIRVARGTYITFVDSDDWIEDGFQMMAEKAVETDADVIAASLCKRGKNGLEIYENRCKPGIYEKDTLRNLQRNIFFSGEIGKFGIIPHFGCKWIKRELLEAWLLRVDEKIRLGEDAAVVFPVIWNAEKICVVPYSYYQYEVRDDSMTKVFQNDEYEKIDILLRYLDDIKKELPIDNIDRQLSQYGIYLYQGAYEKELSPRNQQSMRKKLKKIIVSMERFDYNRIQYAGLDQMQMSVLERVFLKSWSEKHVYCSVVLLCLIKIVKRWKH